MWNLMNKLTNKKNRDRLRDGEQMTASGGEVKRWRD